MDIVVSAYEQGDIPELCAMWNEVVEDGVAFPQQQALTHASAVAFFAEQSFTGLARNADTGEALGLYILHPNNVGRCGHIANASYAVRAAARGRGVGRQLVCHSLRRAKALGFRLMQFNAVVKTNENAIRLYKSLGFSALGAIPGGFFMQDGHYEDIVPFYKTL